MPPRPSVDADDPVVADLLEGTLELIAEAGGFVDPTAVLVARRGQLSLHSDAAPGATLASVPREAMVRVDAVTWADDDDRLVVADLPDDIGEVEFHLLYVQAALHNQCDRLGWLKAIHPALAEDMPGEVVDRVRAVIPSFRTTTIHPRDLLWANRCFRLPLDQSSPRILVPVIDLLNHHRAGASGSWDGVSFSVDARRPFGTAECALDYGMARDALEMAVVYGFADTSALIAHSAPVHVGIPGIGDVSIQGAGRTSDGSWLPVEASASTAGMTLSHLTFFAEQATDTIEDLASATGWDLARARLTVEAVIEANLAVLEPLASTTPDCPATEILTAAAMHQGRVLTSVRDAC